MSFRKAEVPDDGVTRIETSPLGEIETTSAAFGMNSATGSPSPLSVSSHVVILTKRGVACLLPARIVTRATFSESARSETYSLSRSILICFVELDAIVARAWL